MQHDANCDIEKPMTEAILLLLLQLPATVNRVALHKYRNQLIFEQGSKKEKENSNTLDTFIHVLNILI